jgi:hypothetical protein
MRAKPSSDCFSTTPLRALAGATTYCYYSVSNEPSPLPLVVYGKVDEVLS